MSKKHDVPEQILCLCMGSKCRKYNKEHYQTLKNAIKDSKHTKSTEIFKLECTGRCKQAPVLCIQPDNKWLVSFDGKDFKHFLQKYF